MLRSSQCMEWTCTMLRYRDKTPVLTDFSSVYALLFFDALCLCSPGFRRNWHNARCERQRSAYLPRPSKDQPIRLAKNPQDLLQEKQLLHQDPPRRGKKKHSLSCLLHLAWLRSSLRNYCMHNPTRTAHDSHSGKAEASGMKDHLVKSRLHISISWFHSC